MTIDFRKRSSFTVACRRCAAGIAIVTAIVAALSGCGSSEPATKSGVSSSSVVQGRVDHLAQGLDYVFSDDRFENTAFVQSVKSELNQWANGVTDPPPWEPDAMIADLPEALRTMPAMTGLDTFQFSEQDVEFLQECVWTSSIAKNIKQERRYMDYRYLLLPILQGLDAAGREEMQKAEDRLAFLLQRTRPSLNEDQASDLATVMRVFDWIVRNVQLDYLENATVADGTPPAFRGTAGPGYTLHPWQVLKFGHGDPWQRARGLILICRQLDLDVVMLATRDENDKLQPWIPALKIDDELFLFDTELGLPIPAGESGGVATLAEAQADAEILGALSVSPADGAVRDEPYRLSSERIQSTVALIDAGPQWLSRRMAILESRLTADRRMVLTLDASGQAERVKTCNGIESVQLWDVPFLTVGYRNAFEQKVKRGDDNVMIDYYLQEQCYDIDVMLQSARHRALLGRYENDDAVGTVGAKTLFYSRRLTDDFIERLDSDRDMQRMYGIDVDGKMTADQRKQVIFIVKTQLKLVRNHASYWLALSHLETGDPSTAINWLERVGSYDIQDRWKQGTQYNLARAKELIGQRTEAIENYRTTNSAQLHGNMIRARMLEKGEPNTSS